MYGLYACYTCSDLDTEPIATPSSAKSGTPQPFPVTSSETPCKHGSLSTATCLLQTHTHTHTHAQVYHAPLYHCNQLTEIADGSIGNNTKLQVGSPSEVVYHHCYFHSYTNKPSSSSVDKSFHTRRDTDQVWEESTGSQAPERSGDLTFCALPRQPVTTAGTVLMSALISQEMLLFAQTLVLWAPASPWIPKPSSISSSASWNDGFSPGRLHGDRLTLMVAGMG